MIVTVPGDKSVTQRALILAALSEGTSRITGLLDGADPRSTAAALRALGAGIPSIPADGSVIEVVGRGLRGLTPPTDVLDLGNSGTGARLLLGVLAGQPGPFQAVLSGDDSLKARPMSRVTEPLGLMGARIDELGEPGRLPLRVSGASLRPLELELPVASAQVKSALLLAGLVGGVLVLLTEPGRSRDHTERMFRALGVPVLTHAAGPGRRVELRDLPDHLPARDWTVPGDVSSAAFLLTLALLGGAGPSLVVRGVGLNPTRTGILPILGRMGGRLQAEPLRPDIGVGEPTGLLRAAPSRLVATEVAADEIPGAIDEIPVLAVAAARAEGVTRITGATELRVKETDRIRALAENLRAVGVEVEELEDGLEIRGTDGPLGGRVHSFGDHRIAMAFGVLGALPGNEIDVDGAEVVEVSYPGFWDDLREVAAGRDVQRRPAPGSSGSVAAGPRRAVVTLDGPAGSGKSTTAREVARRLGYRHLDSGALYRALTWALLEEDTAPERWPDLSPEELDALGVEVQADGEGFRISSRGRLLDAELRTPAVTARVSELSGVSTVRRWLMAVQRQAGEGGGLVADGRDMGTVVFPDADVKVFLTADLEERARRRLAEHGEPVDTDSLAREGDRIDARDRRDSERDISPLRRPEDATVLDTTELPFEEQVRRVVELVQAWEAGAGA